MVKLSHKILKNKILEQNWKQELLAEALNISDRHIRNLCSKDTDAYVSLCYKLSKLFKTTIESLLIIQETDEDVFC